MNEEMEKGFMMILHAGNAKSLAIEAQNFSEQGEFEQAQERLQQADEELKNAHQVHKDLLDRLANGEDIQTNLILTHALDHLTSAETICMMAERFNNLYRRMEKL